MTAFISRFAPSPTGYLHIGGARTALYAWLFARHTGGQFLLRIEDTDLERSTDASVQAIFDGMHWLGLDYDATPIRQTSRFARYQQVIDDLLARGLAYRCTTTAAELEQMRADQLANKQKPRYDGRCREQNIPADCGVPFVVRFKNPQTGSVEFDDAVKGKISVNNSELDDLIIARSDGSPTYNLTVVVDDIDMHISHVIRGDDHVNNTPRQINLYHALGATVPVFAHVPMILGTDGKRLSKRHGAVSVMQYRDDGFLPEALLNYLLRLGFAHGDTEIFSREEMIACFDLKGINRAPATFNQEKLLWLNQHYLKTLPAAYIADLLVEFVARHGVTTTSAALEPLVPQFAERAKTLSELALAVLPYVSEFADYNPKAAKLLTQDALPILQALQQQFAPLADQWQSADLMAIIHQTAEQFTVGMGKVGMPLRAALVGDVSSPALDVTLQLLGYELSQTRLARALAYIASL